MHHEDRCAHLHPALLHQGAAPTVPHFEVAVDCAAVLPCLLPLPGLFHESLHASVEMSALVTRNREAVWSPAPLGGTLPALPMLPGPWIHTCLPSWWLPAHILPAGLPAGQARSPCRSAEHHSIVQPPAQVASVRRPRRGGALPVPQRFCWPADSWIPGALLLPLAWPFPSPSYLSTRDEHGTVGLLMSSRPLHMGSNSVLTL